MGSKSNNHKAPAGAETPPERGPQEGLKTVDKVRIAHEGPNGKTKGCAGCGSTEKSLMAPTPNARDYAGPMYCLSCNPRFVGVGMVAALDRIA